MSLSINTDYLGMLILKVRAIMAREDTVMLDTGSNPSDDEGPAVLQEHPDDMSRAEIVAEIEGLDPRQQAELVALMWLGRGDAEKEEWSELVILAVERHEGPTAAYLLDHPHLADHWAEALDRLGYGSIVSGVEEI